MNNSCNLHYIYKIKTVKSLDNLSDSDTLFYIYSVTLLDLLNNNRIKKKEN